MKRITIYFLLAIVLMFAVFILLFPALVKSGMSPADTGLLAGKQENKSFFMLLSA